MRFYPIFILFFFVFASSAFAQSHVPKILMDVGAGMASYRGDLGVYTKAAPCISLSLRRHNGSIIGWDVQAVLGKIVGQDIDFKPIASNVEPYTYFSTSFASIRMGGYVNVVHTDHFFMYVNPSVGIFNFTPQNQFGEELAQLPLSRLPEETYNTTVLSFPTTIGAYWLWNNGFGVGIKATQMLPLTDYLDNISQAGPLKKTIIGSVAKRDNISMITFHFYVPLSFDRGQSRERG